MFVTTIVVGAVTVTQPFMLTRRPFIRDIIFYIAAVYWTFFMLWNNWISLWVAIGESDSPSISGVSILWSFVYRVHYVVYFLCDGGCSGTSRISEMEEEKIRNRRYSKYVRMFSIYSRSGAYCVCVIDWLY